MTINLQIKKHMWYIPTIEYYLVIVLKGWNYDTCYNIDEPWKHAKLNKPDGNGYILYDSTYKKFPEET